MYDKLALRFIIEWEASKLSPVISNYNDFASDDFRESKLDINDTAAIVDNFVAASL